MKENCKTLAMGAVMGEIGHRLGRKALPAASVQEATLPRIEAAA